MPPSPLSLARLHNSIRHRARRWQNNLHLRWLGRQVAAHAPVDARTPPVILFNASTRLVGLSLNAAFSLLTAWALHLSGTPVVHFVCHQGLRPCVLGTDRDDPTRLPPCASCLAQSRAVYAHAQVAPFIYQEEPKLGAALQGLTLNALMDLVYEGMPLGALVLPAMRWILRRHTLMDDEPTRYLYRQYILSAWSVGKQFAALVEQVQPLAVVVFNGQFYPEATARWVAQQRGIRVITHEVGLRPFSAFFTEGEATAYPIQIPTEFTLTAEQEARLDAYLSQRFQGQFTMAGIRFWPEMRGLDETWQQRLSAFRQVVPVFTNVIFDTSQPHANTLFPDMFAWLNALLDLIRAHPETLFVIRAHPDELRPGKESRETVAAWVEQHGVKNLPNVVFVGPREYLSSYELIQRSKFVMVYNSSIGLEASIMGVPVLCAGRARYTQYPTVFFPPNAGEYLRQAEAFLNAERIEVPPEFVREARRFLYYQLFVASLPFEDYLEEDGIWPGFVRLKPFDWQALLPQASPTLRVIVEGITRGNPFVLEPAEGALAHSLPLMSEG
ncbi:hypothetical protein QYE77_11040 [Thermanaerothrix sp. 4228-RoL]|uniref:Capsule biosynthesis protein n=1 Tax=Thermanaerothrix solaris TaxID=3058434 RepID=A0ABU3NPR9_9CHLR|nr:hypothetical protein [Thermanaerothrix sp. 4228-RoL]MDT8898797.1 hypothetical protein [Thermanaerothrix sp. 4228-RoL]